MITLRFLNNHALIILFSKQLYLTFALIPLVPYSEYRVKLFQLNHIQISASQNIWNYFPGSCFFMPQFISSYTLLKHAHHSTTSVLIILIDFTFTLTSCVMDFHAEFILENIKVYLQFSMYIHISRYWDGTGIWNPSSWKTKTHLFQCWFYACAQPMRYVVTK